MFGCDGLRFPSSVTGRRLSQFWSKVLLDYTAPLAVAPPSVTVIQSVCMIRCSPPHMVRAMVHAGREPEGRAQHGVALRGLVDYLCPAQATMTRGAGASL